MTSCKANDLTHKFKRGDVIPHDLVYLADENGTKATLIAGADVEFRWGTRQGRMHAVFDGADNKDKDADCVLIVKGPLVGRSSFCSPDSGRKVGGLVIGWSEREIGRLNETIAMDGRGNA